jgi:hypothetical protein
MDLDGASCNRGSRSRHRASQGRDLAGGIDGDGGLWREDEVKPRQVALLETHCESSEGMVARLLTAR